MEKRATTGTLDELEVAKSAEEEEEDAIEDRGSDEMRCEIAGESQTTVSPSPQERIYIDVPVQATRPTAASATVVPLPNPTYPTKIALPADRGHPADTCLAGGK